MALARKNLKHASFITSILGGIVLGACSLFQGLCYMRFVHYTTPADEMKKATEQYYKYKGYSVSEVQEQADGPDRLAMADQAMRDMNAVTPFTIASAVVTGLGFAGRAASKKKKAGPKLSAE